METIPTIVDCTCGLRYMKSEVSTLSPETGHYQCRCGDVLGAWNGNHRMIFEPEDPPLLN